MRKGTRRTAGVAACLALVSVGFATPAGGQGKGKGGGPSGESDTPVHVQFRDAAGDLVRSDGSAGGFYWDGTDGVSAFIGMKNGGFKMNTSKGPRTVTLDFPDCGRLIADPGCRSDVLLDTDDEVQDTGVGLISTGEKIDLRRLAVGEAALAEFSINFPSDLSKSTPNKISFGDLGCGDPLPVTRTATDTWTIEASGKLACLFEVVAKNGRREITDSFNLPFKITITLQ